MKISSIGWGLPLLQHIITHPAEALPTNASWNTSFSPLGWGLEFVLVLLIIWKSKKEMAYSWPWHKPAIPWSCYDILQFYCMPFQAQWQIGCTLGDWPERTKLYGGLQELEWPCGELKLYPMKKLAVHCLHAVRMSDVSDHEQITIHTANKFKNIFTCSHSSSSSLSAWILSRFRLLVSSQCNSSMKVLICYKRCQHLSYNCSQSLLSCFAQLSQALKALRTIKPSCQEQVELVTQHLPWPELFSTFLFVLMMNVPMG